MPRESFDQVEWLTQWLRRTDDRDIDLAEWAEEIAQSIEADSSRPIEERLFFGYAIRAYAHQLLNPEPKPKPKPKREPRRRRGNPNMKRKLPPPDELVHAVDTVLRIGYRPARVYQEIADLCDVDESAVGQAYRKHKRATRPPA